MKASERKLLIITMLIVIATAVFYFWPDSTTTTAGVSGGSTDLEAARKTFHEYAETLRDSGAIRKEFRTMGGRTLGSGRQGPRELFSDELYGMLRDQGFNTPPLETPSYEKIENIEDYATVDIKVTVSSQLYKLVALLEEMEKRGMLVKTFTLDRRNARDDNEVTLSVTVARVIKQDKESRRRLNPGRVFDKNGD